LAERRQQRGQAVRSFERIFTNWLPIKMAQAELKSSMKKLHGSRSADAKSSSVTIASAPRSRSSAATVPRVNRKEAPGLPKISLSDLDDAQAPNVRCGGRVNPPCAGLS
jgi:hypothetical protein